MSQPRRSSDLEAVSGETDDSDQHIYTISDSSKQVDARNYPIKETHFVRRVLNLSVRVGYLEQAVIGIGIIGQGSTQLITNGDTHIGMNLVKNFLTDNINQLINTNSSQLNMFQSKALVIVSQDESVEGNRNIICTSRDSRKIRRNHIRIGTPVVNK